MLGPNGPLDLHFNNLKHQVLQMFQTNHDCIATASSSEEDFLSLFPSKSMLNLEPDGPRDLHLNKVEISSPTDVSDKS